MGAEIERKFLVEAAPEWLGECESRLIEQGYLALEDEGEVRIRIVDGGREALLSVKRGRGLNREEVTVELAEEQAEPLWPLTEGRRLRKRRYLAERDGGPGVWEIDVYEGGLRGLITAELEFESEAEAEGLEPPAWIERELTGEPGYQNRALAESGKPA
jgi:adenylate cyclase